MEREGCSWISMADRTLEVTKLIAENFSKDPGLAALNHYPTLRIQTRNLNNALSQSLIKLEAIFTELGTGFAETQKLSPSAIEPNGTTHYYLNLGPRILQNFLLMGRRVAAVAIPEPKLGLNELDKIRGSFDDFCDLTTTVRQFVDTLVESSYVLSTLDASYLNYRVLESLLSFIEVAPPSLQAPIYSEGMADIVNEFASMSVAKRKNSDFTRASREQFPQRVKFLCSSLGCNYHNNIEGNLVTVYKFCSEFAHIGYVSTLVAGSKADGGPILRGEDDSDVYLSRAENFAELKLQLLRECMIFYADVFIRALRVFIEKMFVDTKSRLFTERLDAEIDSLFKLLRLTMRTLVEPIVRGKIGSGETIEIECNCGGKIQWEPPHHNWDNYCPECGARFEMMEVDPDVSYVISELGPGDVLGGWAVPMKQLAPELRKKLTSIWQRHKVTLSSEEGTKFLTIRDLINIDIETLQDRVEILNLPPEEVRQKCTLFTFVSDGGMQASDHIDITCNCGNVIPFRKPYSEPALHCKCGALIGIAVVSGDPISISGQNPDGTRRQLPVQGSRRRVRAVAWSK